MYFVLLLIFKVEPEDDGTIGEDMMLSEEQADDFLKFLETTVNDTQEDLPEPPGEATEASSADFVRTKRSSFYFERLTQYKWDISRPIPYAFDTSICKLHMV